MNKKREELEKEYAEATAKLEQYQHKGQRYENRIRYYTQGERKKRNHRLSPVSERWRASSRRCAA